MDRIIYMQDRHIHGIDDLFDCYKAGAKDMVNTDPTGPKFHIQKYDYGPSRPTPRTFFQCPNFLITRTYCLEAELLKGYADGIRVKKHIFSDSTGRLLQHWHVEEIGLQDFDDEGSEMSKTWRRGFWIGERTWESKGPQPGEVNELA